MPLSGLTCATLFNHLPDAVFLIDPDTSNILDCNEFALKQTGLARDALINHSVLKLHAEVMDTAQWASLVQAIRANDNHVFTSHYRHAAGAPFAVEVSTSQFWQDGREYVLLIARNISQRPGQERDPSRSEAQLRYALTEASDGLWDWNLQTDEVFFSPQFARMLGYGPDEMKPTLNTWASSLHPRCCKSTLMASAAATTPSTVCATATATMSGCMRVGAFANTTTMGNRPVWWA